MGKRASVKEELFNQRVARGRLLSARLRARMTQWDASRKMGYSNTSKLSKLESLSSPISVSLRDLVKASDCYGVSLDYLIGRSDYPDRDLASVEQLAVYHSTRHFIQGITQSLTETFVTAAEQHTLRSQLLALCNDAAQLAGSVQRLRELNSDFDEVIRGGATVFANIANLEQTIAKIKRRLSVDPQQESKRLKQFRALLEEGEELKQLDMFNGD